MPKRKRSLQKSDRDMGDDEVMFWFGNQLMSYFGDNGDDDEIVADLRGQFPDYPFVEMVFRRGFAIALALPEKDQILLVQYHANRHAPTREAAQAWLGKIRDALFAP